jgi:hypothetical protein
LTSYAPMFSKNVLTFTLLSIVGVRSAPPGTATAATGPSLSDLAVTAPTDPPSTLTGKLPALGSVCCIGQITWYELILYYAL